MKTIKITEVRNYRGGILRVPEFDANGEMLKEPLLDPAGKEILDTGGNPVMAITAGKPATVFSILDYFILDFPRQQLTMKHISECTRLQAKLSEAKERGLDEINLEDSQLEWLVSAIKNDRIGVPMFGQNVISVLSALGATV